jgi:hypothetical protein
VVDVTRVLVGLDEYEVLDAVDSDDGELVVTVQVAATRRRARAVACSAAA